MVIDNMYVLAYNEYKEGSYMAEPKEYRMLRIETDTHRKLRIVAALTGESMLTLIDRLVTEEEERLSDKRLAQRSLAHQ